MLNKFVFDSDKLLQ